jgi:hypothetical protein
MDEALPERCIDLNAQMTSRGDMLVSGTLSGLALLGLTPAGAVGKRFVFNAGGEEEDGQPGHLIFHGTIATDARFGHLAVADERGVFWRAQSTG